MRKKSQRYNFNSDYLMSIITAFQSLRASVTVSESCLKILLGILNYK